MQVIHTIDELRTVLKPCIRQGKSIGLVPTMGALHDGHAALIKASVAECDVTVVSVYLNPIQFGKNEDLDKYPKEHEACHLDMASRFFVERRGEHFGLNVVTARVAFFLEAVDKLAHFGHFFGAFVDEKHDELHFGVVRRDGLRDVLQKDCLTGTRRVKQSVRWMVFSSSRMLPGQLCACSF